MNSPKPRPRSDFLPGIAVRDGFVFMNGEPVATLTKADRLQHAVQDFKDLVTQLDRADLQCGADVDDYCISDFLESELEALHEELVETERLNMSLEAKISELQDRAREDA